MKKLALMLALLWVLPAYGQPKKLFGDPSVYASTSTPKGKPGLDDSKRQPLPRGWYWDGDIVRAGPNADSSVAAEWEAKRVQKAYLYRTYPELPSGWYWSEGDDGNLEPVAILGSWDDVTLRQVERAKRTLELRKKGLDSAGNVEWWQNGLRGVGEEVGAAVGDLGSAIGDAASSVPNPLTAVSAAAESVSNTASSAMKPLSSAADSLTAMGNSVTGAVSDIMWMAKMAFIGVIVLVALLVLGKMISFMHK
jgi:hypothetical protein